MNKYDIVSRIENFAPLETAEAWDCSGWLVETSKKSVEKIMLALTVTENVVRQALDADCDMIIAHHPLFTVPIDWCGIDIYCAHTNLDKADGGTTDTLVEALDLTISDKDEFVRYVDGNFEIGEFVKRLRTISPNLRYVNNFEVERIKRVGFCAGSGAEFITVAQACGADAFVTGDVKFHTALDSKIVVFDIGHFESEVLVLKRLAGLLGNIEVRIAKEKSPFL